MSRWAWAEIDLDAIRHNVGVIRERTAPAEVWAVVKADGYGHGSIVAARAALQAGATALCVALVQEGVVLRNAGIEAPILVLSEQPIEELSAAVAHRLASTVYSIGQVDALAEIATAAGRGGHPVHLKIDTGMHRVGASAGEAMAIADAIAARAPALAFDGVFTHLALADEPADPFTQDQLDRFDDVLAALEAAGRMPPLVHAANSAAAMAHPTARRVAVRVGIATYGLSPGDGVQDLVADLRPALSLRARVTLVKTVAAGDRISYGLRHTFDQASRVATLPIGYADGVRRRLFAVGGVVLLHGRRCPIVGVVTMDQLMVDIGDLPVEVGDEAVLIGEQGGDRITADDWARSLGTIGYEIVCGISARIERRTIDRHAG